MSISHIAVIVLFCLRAASVTGASAQKPSEQWSTYHADGEMDFCRSPAKGFEVEGDFDGNGVGDVARLQTNAKDRSRRLAVWMNGATTPIVLDQKSDRYAGNFLKIKSPGLIAPLAMDQPVDRPPVQARFASLAYGTCEASEVIYYWDPKSGKFKTVWTGD